jgi:hypothetical protein
MTQISEESPTQPAHMDLDGTGLDESKRWIGRADTLMLTLTVYTLLVLQTRRYLFGSIGERRIAKQYTEKKKVTTFLHYSQINTVCSDCGSLLYFSTV